MEATPVRSRPSSSWTPAGIGWHEDGHFIHITSHRAAEAHQATELWLERIGLPYDELYCSYDKVTRCAEIGIDLLIDDSPENLRRAIDAGIAAATILHPWNRDLVAEEDIVAAEDWSELDGELTGKKLGKFDQNALKA